MGGSRATIAPIIIVLLALATFGGVYVSQQISPPPSSTQTSTQEPQPTEANPNSKTIQIRQLPLTVTTPGSSPFITPAPTGNCANGGTDADSDGYCIPEDCDDTNPQVHPGQTQFFITARNNNSFDYNCDGSEEKSPFTNQAQNIPSVIYSQSTCQVISSPRCGTLIGKCPAISAACPSAPSGSYFEGGYSCNNGGIVGQIQCR